MVTLRVLHIQDIQYNMLDSFVRSQQTTKVLVNDEGRLVEKADSFADDWTLERKREIVQSFKTTIEKSGVVVVAYLGEEVAGFAVIEGEFFGLEQKYLELSYIHVSLPARGKKIGEQLFLKVKEEAKKLGADKLYIGAHPAIETQYFYRKMGCQPAKELNETIYNRDVRDVQLEISL